MMVLRWLDCGGEGTTMVGRQWRGYARVLPWVDRDGESAMSVGLRWRWYYYGWAKLY